MLTQDCGSAAVLYTAGYKQLGLRRLVSRKAQSGWELAISAADQSTSELATVATDTV